MVVKAIKRVGDGVRAPKSEHGEVPSVADQVSSSASWLGLPMRVSTLADLLAKTYTGFFD